MLLLTNQRAAEPGVRQMFGEDEEGHGEAQDECDFKRAAFPLFQGKSETHQIGHHDEHTGQNQCHYCVEWVDRHCDLRDQIF